DDLIELVADYNAVLVLPRVKVVAAGWQEIELGVEPRLDRVDGRTHPEAGTADDHLVPDGRRCRLGRVAKLVDPGVARPWVRGYDRWSGGDDLHLNRHERLGPLERKR